MRRSLSKETTTKEIMEFRKSLLKTSGLMDAIHKISLIDGQKVHRKDESVSSSSESID